MAIDIEFKASLDKLIQGIRDGKVSLEDLNGYIEDVGKTGEEAGEQAADGLSDVGDGADDAKGRISDLGTAGKQALEGDLGGAAQSLASSLFAIGPVAGAAAAGATLGINLIKEALGEAEKKREELEKNAGKLAAAYIDAGQKVLDSMTVAQNVTDIVTDPERKKEAEDLAKTLGIDLPQAVLLLAQSQDALNIETERQADAQERINELLATRQAVLDNKADPTAFGIEEGDELNRLLDLKAGWEEFLVTNNLAAESFDLASDALLRMIEQAGNAKLEVDDLGNQLITLDGGKQIFIDMETGQATDAIERFRGDVDGVIQEINTNPAVLSTEFRAPDIQAFKRRVQADLDRNPLEFAFNLGSYGRYLP